MANFASKEIEDKFYQDILSTQISDNEKILLIQDYMLVFYDETIETHYALILLRMMGCDAQSLKNTTIEHRPIFPLEDAHTIMNNLMKY